MKSQLSNVAFVSIGKLISFYLVSMSSAAHALKDGEDLFFGSMPNSVVFSSFYLSNKYILYYSRNESHDKCPICQTNLSGINDSWVLSELPKTDEVNEEILTELNALTKDSNEFSNNHPDDNDDDSDD